MTTVLGDNAACCITPSKNLSIKVSLPAKWPYMAKIGLVPEILMTSSNDVTRCKHYQIFRQCFSGPYVRYVIISSQYDGPKWKFDTRSDSDTQRQNCWEKYEVLAQNNQQWLQIPPSPSFQCWPTRFLAWISLFGVCINIESGVEGVEIGFTSNSWSLKSVGQFLINWWEFSQQVLALGVWKAKYWREGLGIV